MAPRNPGHPPNCVVLFQQDLSSDTEEVDWIREDHGDPQDRGDLEKFVANIGGGLAGRPLWLVALCRTCRGGEEGLGPSQWIEPCLLSWWRNPGYEGPVPPLRNPATDLICAALTSHAGVKEQMKAEAEDEMRKRAELYSWGRNPEFLEFLAHRVENALSPHWAEGADAGLRGELAKLALAQVNWWEVKAALGVRNPKGY